MTIAFDLGCKATKQTNKIWWTKLPCVHFNMCTVDFSLSFFHTNSVDPDQLTTDEANCSGLTLFGSHEHEEHEEM